MTNSRGLSRKVIFMSVLMVFGLALFSGCATTQTWPDYQRNAENKMVVIQEKIGDGLKTGALTPDQSQMFLTTIEGYSNRLCAAERKKCLQKRMGQPSWKT